VAELVVLAAIQSWVAVELLEFQVVTVTLVAHMAVAVAALVVVTVIQAVLARLALLLWSINYEKSTYFNK
jgi:hypothetical protein